MLNRFFRNVNYRAYGLCILSGILYCLTFLNFELFPLTWVCFVPALFAIRDATPLQALRYGLVFGFVTNAGGFYWIAHLIQVFGHLHISLAVLGLALLCLYQGLMLAIALAFVRLTQRALNVPPVWSLPLILVTLELVYPLLFPSYLGNSQYEFSHITQFVDITGMLGLTALVALVNGALFEVLDAKLHQRTLHKLRLIVPISTFALCMVYGLIRLPSIETKTAEAINLKVALIQTNVGGIEKHEDLEQFSVLHQQMSLQAVAAHPDLDLIVWPESAYGQLVNKHKRSITDRALTSIGKPILFGALSYGDLNQDRVAELYNSMFLISASGEIQGAFDKMKLVAFGETIPLSGVFPILNTIFFGGGGFTAGSAFNNLRIGETSLLPMVCYEDLIPTLVRKIWKKDGPADVLVNVTNDSWYGDTHEPLIHLVLASFRSIETRRALIRSTNTGISAIVDPSGRIVQRTGQWTQETLVADVPLIEDGSTTIYMRAGDVVGWLAASLTLLMLVLAKRKRTANSREKSGHKKEPQEIHNRKERKDRKGG